MQIIHWKDKEARDTNWNVSESVNKYDAYIKVFPQFETYLELAHSPIYAVHQNS